MPEQKEIRKYWLTIRLNETERKRLEEHYRTSTCRQLSEYVRNLLLNKPTNIRYRNQSIDDFLLEMQPFRKDLNKLENHFSRSLEILSSLERIGDFRQWMLANEQDKALFTAQITKIIKTLEKYYALWSHE